MQVGGKKGMHTLVMLQYFGPTSEALKGCLFPLKLIMVLSYFETFFIFPTLKNSMHFAFFALEVKLIQMIQQLHLDAVQDF